MNKIASLAFFLMTTITVFGQEKSVGKSNVSLVVQNFIKTNYPTAKKIKYYKVQEGGNTFIEGVFKVNKVEYSLKFFADSLIETEVAVSFCDIPQNAGQMIKSSLDSLFEEYKIIESQEVNPTTNSLYELKIKSKSGNYFELIYNKSGQLIKKTEIFINPIPSQF